LRITRFGGAATDFPADRSSGVNRVGSTDGTGSGNANSTQTVKLFGTDGVTNRFLGAMAHVAIFAGQLSDGNCATLEAAATSDGWTI
jgi:hypothetical protein